jgi:hypothetical protein
MAEIVKHNTLPLQEKFLRAHTAAAKADKAVKELRKELDALVIPVIQDDLDRVHQFGRLEFATKNLVVVRTMSAAKFLREVPEADLELLIPGYLTLGQGAEAKKDNRFGQLFETKRSARALKVLK